MLGTKTTKGSFRKSEGSPGYGRAHQKISTKKKGKLGGYGEVGNSKESIKRGRLRADKGKRTSCRAGKEGTGLMAKEKEKT